MFFIKIRIKGYLENISKNTKELIDTTGIKGKQSIRYIHNDTNHKLIINNNQITLIRENENFINKFVFQLDKENESEYYIKEYNTSINISLLTKALNTTENKIEILYQILDSNDEYRYLLEMENKL